MEFDSIVNLSGINRQVSPFLIQLGEVADNQNLITEKIGVFKKSFDYTVKGSRLSNQLSVIGGIDFYRNDGTHEQIVAGDGATTAEIYKYTTDWTAQSQALTKNYKVRFAYSPTIDTLFAVNYADATRSYNGTSWSTETNVTDAPKGKFIISWGDRIYIFNCVVGESSYPSRAYRTDAIETAATWSADEYITFEDTITGVGTNGDNLFVGCQNSSYIFTLGESKYKVSDIGCVSHEGIVSYGNYTFYPARGGYYAFDGKDTFKVSLPIQEYWKKIPEASYDDIQAKVYNEHIYIYIGDITSPWDSSETLQNVIFDYNIIQNNWNRGSLGNDCTNLHKFVGTTGEKVFFGDDTGYIYQMFDDSGQQNGYDYSSGFESQWIYGTGSGVIDDYFELHASGKYLSSLKVFYKTEESGSWKDLGELNGDQDILKFKVRGHKIKFKLAEHSGKNLYEIYKLDVGYEPVYQIDEDRTR